jgi:hypothetical protein
MDGSARIVATVRSGEAAPDVITSLWKDGRLSSAALPEPIHQGPVRVADRAGLGGWVEGRSAVTSELASLLDARIEQLPTDVLHTLELLTFANRTTWIPQLG